MRSAGALIAVLALAMLAGCASPERQQDRAQLERAAKYNTQLGVGYLQNGNLQLADEKLAKALEQDPKLAGAHNAYAILQERLGRPERADRHYQEALSLAPEDSEARTNYGAFLCKSGRLEEAEAQFLEAVENPLYRRPEAAYAAAGSCALQVPDAEKAERYFRLALDRNGRFLPALYEMARISFREGRTLQASAFVQRYEAALQRLAVDNPAVLRGDPEILWICVQAEAALGNRSAARECADRLKQDFPTSVQTNQLLEWERHGRERL
jgi:type IV pilus assembly protein PilF